MAFYTYGAGPQHVATDKSGNVREGEELTVWTAEAGSQITALMTLDDELLPGTVTTTEEGRYRFKINSRTYPVVWMKDPDGDMWQIEADQIVGSGGKALQLAQDADARLDRIDQTIRFLEEFATPEVLNGETDATEALQAGVDAICQIGGGTLEIPAWARLFLSGQAFAELGGCNNIHIQGNGATIFKTSQDGYYAAFTVRGGGGAGYGSTTQNLTIENLRLKGSFSDTSPANVCLLAANSAQHVTIRNIIFDECTIQGGHSIDLGGCDNVLIEDCIWYGYKPDGVSAPRTEAVNTDYSVAGSGADVPPNLSGLTSRRIHLNRCKFLPVTVAGVDYPAPCPMGAHGGKEDQPFYDMTVTDVLVEDPPVDTGTTGLGGDNPYLRGLFHWPSVRGLRMRRVKVVATDGLGSIRVLQAQSASTGILAGSDPNAPESGTYTTPNIARDIDVELRVEGMGGTNTAVQPLVFIGGVADGYADNILVKLSCDTAYKEAVFIRQTNNARVELNIEDGATSGARLEACTNATVTGYTHNVQLPVRYRAGSTGGTVGPLRATHDTAQTGAVIEVSTDSDQITATNINAPDYALLYSATPVTHAEAATIPAVT